VPEVIEDFFVEASQDVGLKLTNNRNRGGIEGVMHGIRTNPGIP